MIYLSNGYHDETSEKAAKLKVEEDTSHNGLRLSIKVTGCLTLVGSP